LRKQAEDVAPKLSRKKPGWWQNKFHSERDVVFGNGAVNKAGEWFSPNRHPSHDVAITRGQHHMIEFADWCKEFGITYLGPIFFPDD
jgi:hypothetical protein